MKRSLSPKERREQSEAVGAGLFSYFAAQQRKARQEKAKQNGDESTLKVNIPKEWTETKTQSASDSLMSQMLSSGYGMVEGPMTAALYARRGFHERAHKYEQEEKQRIKQEIDQAEREWLAGLSKVKSQSETPHFDSFCVGLQSCLDPAELAKEASEHEGEHKHKKHYDVNKGQLSHLLSELLSPLKKPVSKVTSPVTGLAAGTLGASALATYGLANELRGGGPSHDETPDRIQLNTI